MQIDYLRPEEGGKPLPLRRITISAYDGLGTHLTYPSFEEANAFFKNHDPMEEERFSYYIEWEGGHFILDEQPFPDTLLSDHYLERTVEDLLLDSLYLPTKEDMLPDAFSSYFTADIYMDVAFLSKEDIADIPTLLTYGEGFNKDRYFYLLHAMEEAFTHLEEEKPYLAILSRYTRSFFHSIEGIPRSTYFRDAVLRRGRYFIRQAYQKAEYDKEQSTKSILYLKTFRDMVLSELPIADERITQYGKILYNLFPSDHDLAVDQRLDDADITGFLNRMQSARDALPLSCDLPDKERFYAFYRKALDEEFLKEACHRSHFAVSVRTARELSKTYPKRRIEALILRYDPFAIANRSYPRHVLLEAFS